MALITEDSEENPITEETEEDFLLEDAKEDPKDPKEDSMYQLLCRTTNCISCS